MSKVSKDPNLCKQLKDGIFYMDLTNIRILLIDINLQ